METPLIVVIAAWMLVLAIGIPVACQIVYMIGVEVEDWFFGWKRRRAEKSKKMTR